MTRIDVVVPTWNRASAVLTATHALRRSRGVTLDLVVADDGSTDDTRARLGAEGVRVVSLPMNRGPSAARNAGARMGSAAFIAFVDSDVVVGEGDLARLCAYLADPALGAVVATPGPPLAPRNAAEAHFLARIHHNYLHLPLRISHTNGTLMLVRREAFEAVGGFNERTRGVEDDEFGHALVGAGWQIALARDVIVHHDKRLELLGLLASDFERTIDRVLYLCRTRQTRRAARERRFISTPASQMVAAALPFAPVVWALHGRYLAWVAHHLGPSMALRVALVLACDMPVVHAGLWTGAALWASGRRYR
jgi:GT2 family glycosyltransferase